MWLKQQMEQMHQCQSIDIPVVYCRFFFQESVLKRLKCCTIPWQSVENPRKLVSIPLASDGRNFWMDGLFCESRDTFLLKSFLKQSLHWNMDSPSARRAASPPQQTERFAPSLVQVFTAAQERRVKKIMTNIFFYKRRNDTFRRGQILTGYAATVRPISNLDPTSTRSSFRRPHTTFLWWGTTTVLQSQRPS
jgi:hypothetical protein